MGVASSAAKQLARIESLREAWSDMNTRAVGGQRKSSGVDGQSINGFAEYADENLRVLSAILRSPHGYEFSPLKAHFERKTDGTDRTICIPTVRDRIIQRAILNLLTSDNRSKLENEFSYGFIKGRSVEDAVARAKILREKHPWAYKTDIATFFDTVDRDILREAIKKRVAWRSIYPLLFNAINCEIRVEPGQQHRIKHSKIKPGKGVRQGMPLSPYFANAMLWDFDRNVGQAGFQMVRYADDLVFFASSKAECLAIHTFCATELTKINLSVHELNTKKTYISEPEKPVGFLGVELAKTDSGYAVQLSDTQMQGKQAELNQLASIGSLLKERITISRLLKIIDGKISGWESAYAFCDNFDLFRDRIYNWRGAILQQIFKVELGINPLNLDRRRFLELTPL